MENAFYRLTQNKKNEISENIVAYMSDKDELTNDSVTFIKNWIRTDFKEKTKAFYDVG